MAQHLIDMLASIALTILGGWIFSRFTEEPFGALQIFAIVLAIPTYYFLKPLTTVIFKNYRKEHYHGPREDR